MMEKILWCVGFFLVCLLASYLLGNQISEIEPTEKIGVFGKTAAGGTFLGVIILALIGGALFIGWTHQLFGN